MGVLAAALGWVITDLSCRSTGSTGQLTSCPGWSLGVSILSFLVVTLGVGLILALVYRSIAEANEKRDAGPGTRDP